MGNKMYNEADIQNIANAIRNRYEVSNPPPSDVYKWKVSEMDEAILALPKLSEDAKALAANTSTSIKMDPSTPIITAYKFSASGGFTNPTGVTGGGENAGINSIYVGWGSSTTYLTQSLLYLEATNIGAVAQGAFFGNTTIKNIKINDPSNVTVFYERCLNRTTSLESIDNGGERFIGALENNGSTTLKVYSVTNGVEDWSTTVPDYNFKENEIIFNETNRHFYIRKNNTWEVYYPSKEAIVSAWMMYGSGLTVFPYWISGCTCFNDIYTTTSYYTHAFDGASHLRVAYLTKSASQKFHHDHEKPSMLNYMFDGCTRLEGIVVGDPNTTTFSRNFAEFSNTVGDYMFRNCSALHDVDFGDVTSFGSFCFAGCDALTSLIVDPRFIKGGTFSGNSSLETIVFGDSLGLSNGLDNEKASNYTTETNPTTGLPEKGYYKVTSLQGCGSIFADCVNLYSVRFGCELPQSGQSNSSVNKISLFGSSSSGTYWFKNTPINYFRGVTSTQITEGMVVTDSTTFNIPNGNGGSGTTITTKDGDILTYNGKDFKRNGNTFTEWGVNGSKHPVIYVQSQYIAEYRPISSNTDEYPSGSYNYKYKEGGVEHIISVPIYAYTISLDGNTACQSWSGCRAPLKDLVVPI